MKTLISVGSIIALAFTFVSGLLIGDLGTSAQDIHCQKALVHSDALLDISLVVLKAATVDEKTFSVAAYSAIPIVEEHEPKYIKEKELCG